MTSAFKAIFAAVILVLSFAAPVVADPFEDGVAAYDSGNYANALRIFRLMANLGDARGQFSLGVIYNNGRGVKQDYVRAYMWLSLAAAQGDQTAAEYLDIVVKDMTPAQVAKARKLAREWKPAHTRKGTPTKKSTTQPTKQPPS
jgi:TPR repeat protein